MQRLPTAADKIAAVAAWLKETTEAGTLPAEIGIFVRSRPQLDRARAAVAGAGATTLELSDRDQAASPAWPWIASQALAMTSVRREGSVSRRADLS